MVSVQDPCSSLLQELSKRRNQYDFVEVKGAIYLEGNVWKNGVTKIHPRMDSEASASKNTYSYGDIIVFSRTLSVEGAIEVLNGLRSDGKISLQELPDYVAPKQFRREGDAYGFFDSYRKYGNYLFEWPSILYTTTENVETRSQPLWKPLISPSLPFYPYLSYAIEKEVGFDPGGYFGRVIVLVPDYRARISLVFRSKSQIRVKLDVGKENPENLICKYYCVTEGGAYQNEFLFKGREKDIEFEHEVKEFHVCLLVRGGEVIDYKSYLYTYPAGPGVEVEYTPENIEFIVKGGENEKVEFKEKIPEDHNELVESIVAFANGKGGRLFLGVDGNCNIVGLSPKDLDKERIVGMIRDRCEPAVEMKVNVHEVGDKRVVIIEVSPGKNKPYLVRGKGPYIRVGSSDRIATRAELDQLYGRRQLT